MQTFFLFPAIGSFHCIECNQTFKDNTLLMKHSKKNHCNSYLVKRDHVVIKQPQFNDQGLLKCDLCHGGFSSELAFYYHYFESHKPSRECLDCKVCGKLSLNVMDFKRHILIIHGGYTHACYICGKRYG